MVFDRVCGAAAPAIQPLWLIHLWSCSWRCQLLVS